MNEPMAQETMAQQYGVPVDELARWRRQNRSPAYYDLSRQTVRYDPDSVRQWFRHPANARFHRHPAPALIADTTRDGSPEQE